MKRKWVSRMIGVALVASMTMTLLSGCAGKTENIAPSVEENTKEATETTDTVLEELGSGTVKWSEETVADGWIRITNDGGATLGYSPESGVKLLQSDGYAFKDLNQNGELDAYEDWRLDAKQRAENLASLMSTEEQLPLMFVNRYDTDYKPGDETINDTIKGILDNGVRGISTPFVWGSVENAVKYINIHQAYVEALPYGIPMDEHGEAGNGITSSWGNNLALAATFDPEIVADYAKAMSEEYRAIGINTTLTPQIDIASEPRWSRIKDEFGEDPALVRDMAVAYVNALQSSYDENGNDLGWGMNSVNTEIKHFPGDGPGESGRESHNFYGAYAVYPGDNLYTHLIPFEASLDLPGLTGSASGVMPSYSIAVGADGKPIGGEGVASGYNSYKLTDILRGDLGFEGVISSDFIIVDTNAAAPQLSPRIWGVEGLTVPERRLMAIEAGIDQFGGEADVASLKEGYALGVEKNGEEQMQDRIRESAVRILKNMFQIGLFDNAYLSLEETNKVVKSDNKVAAGTESLQKSVVMLKNSSNLIQVPQNEEKPTVYIPMIQSTDTWALPVDAPIVNEYFEVITDTVGADGKIVRASAGELANVDYAFVRISSPSNVGGGYDSENKKYIPLSLQYGPYTANSSSVRTISLGGLQEEVVVDSAYGAQTTYATENRSYYNNSAKISNASDLDAVVYATENVDKVIVSINAANPMVFSEFESKVDAILIDFATSGPSMTRALCEIVTGKVEPSGLLPLQMPANMDTVEAQFEDVPRDMECHLDADGNTYDFAFGLNWSGVINDERVKKYDVDPLAN